MTSSNRLNARIERLVFALLLLHAGRLAYAAAVNSVAIDEFVHLPAGVAYWRFGDFSICNLSPPLLRLWAAIPVLFAGVHAPLPGPFAALDPTLRHWAYGEAFLRANIAQYHHLFVLARWCMIPWALFGGWVAYRWARELYGIRAGLAACALYVLCPNIAAHGSLVSTDMGTATAVVTAAWLWWRFCQRPTWPRGLLAGAAIALAHLCKFTALMLWPVMGVMAAWCGARTARRSRRRFAMGALGAGVATLLAFNIVYGFKASGQPLSTYQLQSWALSRLHHLPGWLPVPLPRDFVVGSDAQKAMQERSAVTWSYYPLALACKLPISTLLLSLLACGSLFAGRVGRLRWSVGEAPVIAAFVIIALGVAVCSHINEGIRYLLPAFPLLFIIIGRLWSTPGKRWMRSSWFVRMRTMLLCILAFEAFTAYPRDLTFVNAATGGPRRAYAYRWVNDSNFDWGQGLIDLKRWMQREKIGRIQLAYFGSVDPAVYGIDYVPIAALQHEGSRDSMEAYVAISSRYVAGLGHGVLLGIRYGFTRLAFYKELQRKTPVAVVGSTIFVYRRGDVESAIQEHEARESLRARRAPGHP